MSEAHDEYNFITQPFLSVLPERELVPVADIVSDARDLSEQYFDLRKKVLAAEKIDGEQLVSVQTAVGEWARSATDLNVDEPFSYGDYAFPSREKIVKRYELLSNHLKEHYTDVVSDDEIEASRLFVESSFAMYEETPKNGEIHPDADGSFAFVVPTRLSRKDPEYGPEVEPIMPILRYLPNEMRAAFAVGLPPLILDTYNRDAEGKRGYLVLAPIWTDMMSDLELGEAYDAAVKRVNDTVDFAYSRLGAEIQGLGAIIPALTKFGQNIENSNVITTTGHGGTIQIIMETLERAANESYIRPEQLKKIGVLGLGSIGYSIADITRSNYPDAEIRVYDSNPEKVSRVVCSIGAIAAESEVELIRDSEVIISAIVTAAGPLDLEALGVTAADMEGKLIIDDSQPCSVSPEQVKKLGGTVAWVIGHNGIERSSYDFGGSMADGKKELFGCEAEAATIAAYYGELLATGMDVQDAKEEVRKVALRSPVTPDKVRAIAELFEVHNVEAAPLQAFGEYLR